MDNIVSDFEIPHYSCGDCVYWKCEKGRNLPCKRIDHDKIKFRKPFFKSYDGNQHGGIICSDFEPKNKTWWCWRSFLDFWPLYVQEWIPYGKTDILYYFVLNGDESVEYGVPLMDFVNGTMIDGNTLKAVEKMYYIRIKDSNWFGYRLIHEPINGVSINGGNRK